MHALSFPTWIIHVSSVLEWAIAIWLIANYGKLTQNSIWRWFALAMTPALVSAMCACTWHLFDNNPDLDWLVTLQATTTLIGNFCLAIAAYYLWQNAQGQNSKGQNAQGQSAKEQNSKV